MRVYVTSGGEHVRRRVLERVAGISRREAAHLKRRKSIDVDRATAAKLVKEGWAGYEKPLVEDLTNTKEAN